MTDTYNPRVLCEGLDRFRQCRVLVVGDVIMDEFIWGRVERISPEAPVPEVEVVRESLMLGGAGNVVENIVALGGNVVLCGVIGNDVMGRELVRMVRKMNSPTHGLVVEDHRPTTIKTRVVAHSQQVVRVDREERRPVDEESIEKILATINENIDAAEAILVADYGKGVVTERIAFADLGFLGGSVLLFDDGAHITDDLFCIFILGAPISGLKCFRVNPMSNNFQSSFIAFSVKYVFSHIISYQNRISMFE